jgi:hypothetical protein
MGCSDTSMKFSIVVEMMARQPTDDPLRFPSHIADIFASTQSGTTDFQQVDNKNEIL